MPPIDDLPPPPQAASSIDDLPPPPPKKQGASALGAGAETYLNELTNGHAPQIEGAYAKPLSELADPNASLGTKALDVALMGSLPYHAYKMGKAILSPDEDYLPARDAALHRLNDYENASIFEPEKRAPIASLVGKTLGTGAKMYLMGGFSPYGTASAGARIANAAAGGGAYGASMNPGDVEGETNPLQPVQRAKNAITSALTSAGLSTALEGTASALRPWAQKKAVSALGGTQNQVQNLGDNTGKAGQLLLDEGITGPATTREGMLGKIEGKIDQSQNAYGSLLKSADAAGAPKVSGTAAALEVMKDPTLQRLENSPANPEIYDKIQNRLNLLSDKGDMSLEEANALKGDLDDQIKYGRKSLDKEAKDLQPWLYKMRDALRSNMSGSVDSLGTQAPSTLIDQGKRLNLLYQLQEMADKGAVRDISNQSFGLGDKIATGIGASLGDSLPSKIAGGAVGGAVNHASRMFGKQGAAWAVGKATPWIAQKIESNPEISHLATSATMPWRPAQQNTLLPPQDILDEYRKNPAAIEELNSPELRAIIKKKISPWTQPQNGGE